MNPLMSRLVLIGTIVAITATAHAQSIPIINPSFESPATTTGALATGWTMVNDTDTHDIYNPYTFQGSGAYYTGATSTTDPANGGKGLPGIDGENVAFVFTPFGGVGAGISQTLNTTLVANQQYTLTVSTGRRNGFADGGGSLFAGSLIELMAGTTVIASNTDNVGPTAGTFHDQTAILSNSSNFSDLIGQPLEIRLLTTLPQASSNQATDWDNVRLTANAVTVPESCSFALFGWGITSAVIIIARRRGKRK